MYKIIIRSLATGRQIRKRFYESEAHFKKQYNRWATPQHKVFYIVEAYVSNHTEWERIGR